MWAPEQWRTQRATPATDVYAFGVVAFGPRSLINNIPAPTQQWKAPVEDWVRDLYDKRQRKAARKGRGRASGAPPPIEDPQ